jgi:hypothetical protein
MSSLSEALVPTDSPNMNNKENEVKPTQDMKTGRPRNEMKCMKQLKMSDANAYRIAIAPPPRLSHRIASHSIPPNHRQRSAPKRRKDHEGRSVRQLCGRLRLPHVK